MILIPRENKKKKKDEMMKKTLNKSFKFLDPDSIQIITTISKSWGGITNPPHTIHRGLQQ